jgi:putative glutamine amidotransferase
VTKKPLIGISANISPANDEKRLFNRATEVYYIQQHYMTFVEAGGGLPVLLTPTRNTETIAELVNRIDGVLLVGGIDVDPSLYGEENTHSMECNLDRDRFDIALVQQAREMHKSVLGICRGIQVLNVAYGGSLYQHIPASFKNPLQHGMVDNKESFHLTQIDKGTILWEILGEPELRTNSSHHQSVKQSGDGLEVVARSVDGVVEAVIDSENPLVLGVQWHPERMQDDDRQLSIARWLATSAHL